MKKTNKGLEDMENSKKDSMLVGDDTTQQNSGREGKLKEKKVPIKNIKEKTMSDDKIWDEKNVREEKKALKLAKKAKFRETHLSELVGHQVLPHEILPELVGVESTNTKQDAKVSTYDKVATRRSVKKDSVAKNHANHDKYNADEMQNMIKTPIAKIIINAEKKRHKNKEKSTTRQKVKRVVKQENVIKFSNHTAKDGYPLYASAATFMPSQEHASYSHIMDHGANVSNYARMLFLGLEPLHGLSDIWLRRLLLAAQYHDVGTIDGSKSHHKHSYVRIKSDFEILISDEDREIVALLARYHRKAMPRQEHEEFAKLSMSEQEKLCKTASFLRIADALDYGHKGVIEKIDVFIHHSRVTLVCHSKENLSQEQSRVLSKGDLFERTFKKEIQCKQA